MAVKDKEIQAIFQELLRRSARPVDPNVQPAASTFQIERPDLVVIEPYSDYDYEGSVALEVIHRECDNQILFDLHPTDPILSEFTCDNFHCDSKWRRMDLQAMRVSQLQNLFYTRLVEDPKDLLQWPVKIIEVESGKTLYTTTAPITLEELIMKRVKRLLEIRSRR